MIILDDWSQSSNHSFSQSVFIQLFSQIFTYYFWLFLILFSPIQISYFYTIFNRIIPQFLFDLIIWHFVRECNNIQRSYLNFKFFQLTCIWIHIEQEEWKVLPYFHHSNLHFPSNNFINSLFHHSSVYENFLVFCNHVIKISYLDYEIWSF